MRFSRLPLILALGLSAQGFAWGDTATAPVAPISAPPPVGVYVPPNQGWDKDNQATSLRLTAAFAKFLAREEGAAKAALVAAVMAMPDHDPKSKGMLRSPHDPFLQAKVKAIRALKANYPPAFWAWLDRRQDIRMGLFLTTHPTPPRYVANLAYLWKAAGQKNADKYAHLLLAAALRTTSVDAVPAASVPAVTPVELRLAKLIAVGVGKVPEPLVFFIHHKAQFAENADLKPEMVAAAKPGTLARLLHTYPDRGGISPADNTLKLISRLEAKVTDFKDGLRWPLFHVETAPYYLLNPLTSGVSAREQNFIWDRFVNPAKDYAGKITGARVMGYGKYGWEYTAPEVRYKKSDWHPDSWPRILEDGGVCGRMAQLESVNKNILGMPSCTAGQPIHCALMVLHQDAKGKYVPAIGQSVTGGWSNTTPSMPLGVTPAVAGFEHAAAAWLALAETANRVSEADYYRSLFFYQAAQDMKQPADRIHLLRMAVNLNPYHLGAWDQLVSLSAQMGPQSFNSVMLGMADRLAYPDGPPPQKAADKQAAAAPAPPEVPRNKIGDRIMRVCAEKFLAANYERMLAASVKNHDALTSGVKEMWRVMTTLDDAGVMGGGGPTDAVFRKYAAKVNSAQAFELFKSNFEMALLGRTDVYGATGGPLITVVDSFRDIGAQMAPAGRVASLKSICEKLADLSPKYRLGSWPTMVYGKTYDLSRVEPNRAYASAINQLAQALRDNGQADLADGTLARYRAEGERLRRQGIAEDRNRFSKNVLEQIKRLQEEDRKRL